MTTSDVIFDVSEKKPKIIKRQSFVNKNMVRESLIKTVPYLVLVPMSANPPVIGLKFYDTNRFMGQSLGWLKWPTIFALIFAIIAFGVTSYYLRRYTKGFYAERKVPKSWKLILLGIFITIIAEFGEMLSFYEWPNAGLVEANLLLAVPHALGGILLGVGTYLLYKEITL